MRRLVLLGLLGLGVSACQEQEPVEQQEAPLCPEQVIEEFSHASPEALRSTSASALRSTSPSTTDADGRQRVLVRFRKPSALSAVAAAALPRQREDKVRQLGARVRSNWPRLNAMALSLSPEERARLARDPEVLSISEDRKVHALGTSALAPVAGLLAGERGALNTTGSAGEYTWAVRQVQADKVWDADGDGVIDPGAFTGAGIKVCVIDSGIDREHAELRAAYGEGKDFIDGDDNPEDKDAKGWGGGHGTHVAGTIAAQLGSGAQVNPNDGTLSRDGMVGVAPGATLLIARVLDKQGNGDTSAVIDALEWCQERGAKIASLSLGSSKPLDEEREAFDNAWNAGMLTIAASGNAGELATPESKTYPAAYDSVLAVGAVDAKAEHPKFSQGGDHLSLVAPGVNVYSTYPRGQSPFAELQVGGTFFKSSVLDYVSPQAYEGKLVDCGLANGLRSCPGATCEGFVAYVDRGDITFADKVKNVRSQGARAVIIGNNDPEDDEDLGFTLGSPLKWPAVAAVASTTVPSIRAQFGSHVSLSVKGSDYALSTGTSMATPHVAGVAALVWSARPNLTNAQVRGILERTAKDLTDVAVPESGPGKDIAFGWGLVQAKAAVDEATKGNP
ncbi:S8 family serine peptidase [Archangium sp.]|jgi:subtilisin family serine protease|uniref:S8 family serine peptidase n=1 Tax=Archangium sp. TaxID=1872627 RepID=UPI002EDB5BDF